MLAKIRGVFAQNAFLKNVTMLVGGTVFGQGLLTLISPILTRFYTPGEFGIFGTYSALLGIILVLATLHYEYAVPLPEDDDEALSIVVLAFGISVVVSALTLAIFLLFGDQIAALLSPSETSLVSTSADASAEGLSIRPFLWLVPVGMFAYSVYNILSYWAIRKEAFGRLSQTSIVQSVGSASVQLGLGVPAVKLWLAASLGPLSLIVGPLGLLLGHITSKAAGIGNLARLTLPALQKANLSWASIRKAAVIHKNFPLYNTWSALLYSVSLELPVILLASLYGNIVVGLFAFANRILRLPMILVGEAIRKVFFSTAVKARREGTLQEESSRIFTQLVKLGLPILLVVGIAAPELFATVFSAQWREAGRYAQLLIPWLLFNFLSAPLSALPYIFEKQKYELFFQAILAAGQAACLILGSQYGDSFLAIGLYGVYGAICFLGYTFWNMYLGGNSVAQTLSLILREMPTALFMAIPVIITKFISMPNQDLWVFIVAALTLLVLLALNVDRFRDQMRQS